MPPRRPAVLDTTTVEKKTGCGSAYITISLPGQGYFEIFALLGKSGGCPAAIMSSLTRTLTVAVNSGASKRKLIKQLIGTRCPNDGPGLVSCPQALAEVLTDYGLGTRTSESGQSRDIGCSGHRPEETPTSDLDEGECGDPLQGGLTPYPEDLTDS